MTVDIDGYIKDLRHTITVAALNYDIWRAYTSEDCRPLYVQTMNSYSPFFQTSLHAHFVALLVALYRLYEKRTDTFNIPFVLRTLKERKALPEDTLESLDRIYEKAKPLWVKVNILRNKAFGHRSSAHTVEGVFKKAGITPNQLRELAELTKELLNELTQAWDKSTYLFDLDAREATFRLLQDLKCAYEKRKAEPEH